MSKKKDNEAKKKLIKKVLGVDVKDDTIDVAELLHKGKKKVPKNIDLKIRR